jgi:hypothetical protein
MQIYGGVDGTENILVVGIYSQRQQTIATLCDSGSYTREAEQTHGLVLTSLFTLPEKVSLV